MINDILNLSYDENQKEIIVTSYGLILYLSKAIKKLSKFLMEEQLTTV